MSPTPNPLPWQVDDTSSELAVMAALRDVEEGELLGMYAPISSPGMAGTTSDDLFWAFGYVPPGNDNDVVDLEPEVVSSSACCCCCCCWWRRGTGWPACTRMSGLAGQLACFCPPTCCFTPSSTNPTPSAWPPHPLADPHPPSPPNPPPTTTTFPTAPRGPRAPARGPQGTELDYHLKTVMGQGANTSLDVVTDPRLRNLIDLVEKGQMPAEDLPPLREMLPALQVIWVPGACWPYGETCGCAGAGGVL